MCFRAVSETERQRRRTRRTGQPSASSVACTARSRSTLRASFGAGPHSRGGLRRPILRPRFGCPKTQKPRRSAASQRSEIWSGRRDSNPRPQPWQGCALPLSYTRSHGRWPQRRAYMAEVKNECNRNSGPLRSPAAMEPSRVRQGSPSLARALRHGIAVAGPTRYSALPTRRSTLCRCRRHPKSCSPFSTGSA